LRVGERIPGQSGWDLVARTEDGSVLRRHGGAIESAEHEINSEKLQSRHERLDEKSRMRQEGKRFKLEVASLLSLLPLASLFVSSLGASLYRHPRASSTSRMAAKSTSRATASKSASKESKGRATRGRGAHTVRYAEEEEEIDDGEGYDGTGGEERGGDDDDDDEVDPVR
jgi:hypothetical protein